jgi:SAM-dependent methyltransferase
VRPARVLRARLPWVYRAGRAGFEAAAAVLPPWELPPIPGPVSRADLMLHPSLHRRPPVAAAELYDRQGRQAVDHLVAAVGDPDQVRAVLDVGCGHGRVLRHLPASFPGARIVGAEIDRRAAAFCRRHLGVEAVAVPSDPAALPAGPFDLIWLGSVVTHLDRAGFDAMVAATSARLAPGGVLALTTLQPDRAPLFDDVQATGAATDPDGFTYVPYPHSTDGSYGLAFASPAFVQGAIGLEVVAHRQRGWDDLQDLWAFRAPG